MLCSYSVRRQVSSLFIEGEIWGKHSYTLGILTATKSDGYTLVASPSGAV